LLVRRSKNISRSIPTESTRYQSNFQLHASHPGAACPCLATSLGANVNIVRSDQPLFTPVRMGALQLRNRIVMAPLTRMRASNPEHAPTQLHAEYYAQRASGGLIIGECTEISPDAYGWADTPGLWSAEQIRGSRGVSGGGPTKGGPLIP